MNQQSIRGFSMEQFESQKPIYQLFGALKRHFSYVNFPIPVVQNNWTKSFLSCHFKEELTVYVSCPEIYSTISSSPDPSCAGDSSSADELDAVRFPISNHLILVFLFFSTIDHKFSSNILDITFPGSVIVNRSYSWKITCCSGLGFLSFSFRVPNDRPRVLDNGLATIVQSPRGRRKAGNWGKEVSYQCDRK